MVLNLVFLFADFTYCMVGLSIHEIQTKKNKTEIIYNIEN